MPKPHNTGQPPSESPLPGAPTLPAPVWRTPHHDWSIGALRRFCGWMRREELVDQPVSVDVLLRIGLHDERLGPVGDVCRDMFVGMELYAAAPRRAEAARVVAKAMALSVRPGARPGGAALVALCRHRIGAFAALPLAETEHRGWWRLRLGLAELHVLDASMLSSDGTWGAVRFIANPPPSSPAQDLFAELQRDPRVSRETIDRIAEAIMNEQLKPTLITQRRSAASIVRSQGRKEGRKEGREEGRKEGREEGREEVLRAVAPVVLLPDELAALGAEPTLKALEAALRGRIPGI